MAENHNITTRKKNPTISDFNDLLKAGIPMKQAEGLLSSLLQKGIVEVEMAYADMNVFDKGEFLYTFTEKFCKWVVAGGDYTKKN